MKIPLKSDVLELLKRKSDVKNIRNITESPLVKTKLFDINKKTSLDMGNKDRESLTQLSHRFRKTVNEEVEGNTLSKNSRWWDSYQSILKSEVKNRRNLSVESKPQSI